MGMVYRFDAAALLDWEAALGQHALRWLPEEPKQRSGIVTRLQIEYLQSAVPEGVVLSLPPLGWEPGSAVRPELQRYFIVVNKTVRRQKRLATTEGKIAWRMHFQVSIQDMEYFVAAAPAGDDGGQQSGGQQSEGHQADREGPDREEPKRHALCFSQRGTEGG